MLLPFVACQHSENRYAQRTIAAEELLGTWTLTPYGLKSLQDVGVKDHLSRDEHVLTLRADHSCAVKTVFGLPGDTVEYRIYESGCTWRLGNDGHQTLDLELSPPPGAGGNYFYFAEKDGALIIWWYASDPDAWRYLEFANRGVEESGVPSQAMDPRLRLPDAPLRTAGARLRRARLRL
jgi:hypothetical protein